MVTQIIQSDMNDHVSIHDYWNNRLTHGWRISKKKPPSPDSAPACCKRAMNWGPPSTFTWQRSLVETSVKIYIREVSRNSQSINGFFCKGKLCTAAPSIDGNITMASRLDSFPSTGPYWSHRNLPKWSHRNWGNYLTNQSIQVIMGCLWLRSCHKEINDVHLLCTSARYKT